VSLNATTESTYLCGFMLNSYLKVQEKETMWRNLTRGGADDKPGGEEGSSEYRTFE
jgi:hypothetical protein